MDSAIERKSRRLVNASQALSSREYVCRRCGKPVQLTSPSLYMVRHFRHEKGVASAASCDLYVASSGYYYEQLAEQVPAMNEFSVSLGLLVQKETAWSLQVAIRSDTFSNVRVLVNVGKRSNSAYLGDAGKPSYLLADPDTKPYKILSYDGTPVADVDGHSTPGLADRYATVFGPIGRLGRQAAHRPAKIVEGRTYALLWPRTLALTPPQEIVIIHFQERLEWTGVLISVPEDAPYETRSWLERYCGLKYEPSPQSVVVVWPPALGYFSTQHVLLDQASDAVIVQVNGGACNQPLEVTSKIDDLSAYAGALEEDGFFLFNSGGVHEAEFISHAEDDSSLFVDFTKYTRESQTSFHVSLRFKSSIGETFSVSAFDERATYFIGSVRNKTMSLIDIVAPPGADCVVYAEIGGLWVPQMQISVKSADPFSVGYVAEQPLQKIGSLITESKFDLKLDFGIFGYALCKSIPQSFAEKALELPIDLRDRIRAFLAQFPLKTTRCYNVMSLDDDGLIEAFRTSRGSQETLALKNSIARSIATFSVKKNDEIV